MTDPFVIISAIVLAFIATLTGIMLVVASASIVLDALCRRFGPRGEFGGIALLFLLACAGLFALAASMGMLR
jgi:hypothetical protein